jgi:hypothetical protein
VRIGLSNKNVAVGTVLILVSTLAVTLATEIYILRSINPIAAIVAVAVAVIGVAWFIKTAKS